MILVPPKWTVEPEDTNVVMGYPCMLHCQADGYPMPAVVWKKSFGMLYLLQLYHIYIVVTTHYNIKVCLLIFKKVSK